MEEKDLRKLVETILLPGIVSFGFAITSSDSSASFDNADVVLDSPNLRLRVLREQSIVFADFGPASEKGIWYDSAVLAEYLGLSSDGGFHDDDVQSVLKGIRDFVISFGAELAVKFEPRSLADTRKELRALQDLRAARRLDE